MHPDIKKLVTKHGSPLAIFSPKMLEKQFRKLRTELPNVELFFAVKSLPKIEVIDTLDSLGSFFDVATLGEIALLRKQGINGHRCIFTHPIKKTSDIKAAIDFGISTFVYDNEAELKKFIPYKNQVQLLLRISFPNEEAEIKLFEKFGTAFEQAHTLLNQSNALEINTVGISFHVGSRMRTSTEYIKAIKKSAQLYAWSEVHLNHRMYILDIGGGFPCFESESEESSLSFFYPIKSALNEYFPKTKIIAEPGRCISNSCIGIATTVIGKSVKNGTHWYYLDDGIYGSFSGICFDNRALEIEVINKNRKGKFNSVLTGPTCDSFDTLAKNIPLPNLEINDILYSPNMGAYTLATCTQFNSIHEATLISVDNIEQEAVSKKKLELCL